MLAVERFREENFVVHFKPGEEIRTENQTLLQQAQQKVRNVITEMLRQNEEEINNKTITLTKYCKCFGATLLTIGTTLGGMFAVGIYAGPISTYFEEQMDEHFTIKNFGISIILIAILIMGIAACLVPSGCLFLYINNMFKNESERQIEIAKLAARHQSLIELRDNCDLAQEYLSRVQADRANNKPYPTPYEYILEQLPEPQVPIGIGTSDPYDYHAVT